MDVAHELALIACRQCKKMDHESEVGFANRLYETYYNCYQSITLAMEKKEAEKAVSQRIDLENLI